MREDRSSSERKSSIIKLILIIILLLFAMLSAVLYMFAYPKATVFLHDDETGGYGVVSSFPIRKYRPVGYVAPKQKPGYDWNGWWYEDNTLFDPNREVDTDVVNLYADYIVKNITISYGVQYWNEEEQVFDYDYDVFPAEVHPFATTTNVNTGRDKYGRLNAKLIRDGYTFAGWTTEIVDVDKMESYSGKVYKVTYDEAEQKYIGEEMPIPPNNVNLYAYWVKNEYTIAMHNGIEYQLDENKSPIRYPNDSDTPEELRNKFIIKNTGVNSNVKIKYQQTLADITENTTPVLTAEHVEIGAEEYEFKGWYLDPDYNIPTSKYSDMYVRVRVESAGGNRVEIPYLYSRREVLSAEESEDGKAKYEEFIMEQSYLNEDGQYVFALYPRWERKSYTLSFDKVASSSNGKIESIQVYKYDNMYGKYYQTKLPTEFSRDIASTEFFSKLDLSSKSITTDGFLNSNPGYRFIGWANTSQDTEDRKVYYEWKQQPKKSDNLENKVPSYVETEYTHTVSGDVTLYAQWAKIYYVQFKDRMNNAKHTVTYEMIIGEWMILPGEALVMAPKAGETAIEGNWGWNAISDHQYFAGWNSNKIGSVDILEHVKNADGVTVDNNNYFIKIEENPPNITYFYPVWASYEYIVNLHYGFNYNGKEVESMKVDGGSTIYPTNPTRDGYIFEGWERKFADGSTSFYPKQDLYNNISFKITGTELTINYYAVWTFNYTIEYSINGGNGTVPASKMISGTAQSGEVFNKDNLTMTFKLHDGSKFSRKGYDFKGWSLSKDTSYTSDSILKKSTKMIFDFANGKAYRADVASSEMFDMTLVDGINKPNGVKETIVLYAIWEPNAHTLTIFDCVTKQETKVPEPMRYGVDFNLIPYFQEYDKHIGYRFLGLYDGSSKDSNAYAYKSIDEKGNSVIVGSIAGETITKDKKLYAVYEKLQVKIDYMYINKDGEEKNFDKSFTVDYGAKLKLDTPSSSLYGNPNFIFSYWYCINEVSQKEVAVYSGEFNIPDAAMKEISEGLLGVTLWAKFTEQTFTMTFIINDVDGNPIEKIETLEDGTLITVKIGQTILADDPIVSYINSIYGKCVDDTPNGYYTDGFYYQTRNNSGKRKFSYGITIDNTTFDILKVSTNIDFELTWIPYKVTILYYANEGEGDINNSLLATRDYSYSKKSFNLENNDLIAGETISKWYWKDSSNGINYVSPKETLYFDSIYDMLPEGSIDTTTHIITLKFYAQTQVMLNVVYNVYNNGSFVSNTDLVELSVTGDTNYIVKGIEFIKDYTVGGIVFNGWRLCNNKGEYIGENITDADSLIKLNEYGLDELNNTIYLYADLSVKIVYERPALDGRNIELTSQVQIINLFIGTNNEYSDETAYLNEYNIDFNAVDGFGDKYIDADYVLTVNSGTTSQKVYSYFGVLVNGYIYPEGYAAPISLDLTANIVHQVVSILTREIVVEYYISADDTEDKQDSEPTLLATYTYLENAYGSKYIIATAVTGHAGQYVLSDDNIDVEPVAPTKYGCTLEGWKMTAREILSMESGRPVAKYETVNDATIYTKELLIERSIKLQAIFAMPEADKISGEFEYYYVNDKGVEVKITGLTSEQTAITNSKEYLTITHNNDYFNLTPNYKDTKEIVGWKDINGLVVVAGGGYVTPQAMVTGDKIKLVAVLADKIDVVIYRNGDKASVTIEDVLGDGALTADVISLEDYVITVEDVELGGWEYIYTNASGKTTKVQMSLNDKVVFKKGATHSSVANPAGYTLYTLPYDKAGATYTISLIVNSTFTINAYIGGQLFSTGEVVRYGSSYTAREILDLLGEDALLAEKNTSADSASPYFGMGIVAWTTNAENLTTKVDLNACNALITEIKKDVTLYAVWQARYTFTFATLDSVNGYEFEYKIGSGVAEEVSTIIPFFAGDVISLDNRLIKSIYFKGHNVVYYENGKWIVCSDGGNDYYQIIGFTINGVDHLFSQNGYTYITTDTDVTATPIVERLYQVQFQKYNGSSYTYDKNNTQYVKAGTQLEIANFNNSKYYGDRTDFVFSSWEITPTVVVTNGKITVNADLTFNSRWTSNLFAIFYVNVDGEDKEVFRTRLTETLQIDEISTATELASTTNAFKRDMIEVEVDEITTQVNVANGNNNVYLYEGKYYYLSGYFYTTVASTRTLSALSSIGANSLSNKVTGSNNVKIKLDLLPVYTLDYSLGDYKDLAEDALVPARDYFTTQFGRINAANFDDHSGHTTGTINTINIATIDKSVTRNYYIPGYWICGESGFDFGSTIGTKDGISSLYSASSDSSVILNLSWTPKTYQITLNAIGSIVDNNVTLLDPYDTYKAYSDASAFNSYDGWTNVSKKYLLDSTCNSFTVDNISLRYEQIFYLTYPTCDDDGCMLRLGNYYLVGWTIDKYALGKLPTQEDIDAGRAFLHGSLYGSTDYWSKVRLDSEYVSAMLATANGVNNVINLYPIYYSIPTHVYEIEFEEGALTYSIENTDQYVGYITDQYEGYMSGSEATDGEQIFGPTDGEQIFVPNDENKGLLTIYLPFYNKLVIGSVESVDEALYTYSKMSLFTNNELVDEYTKDVDFANINLPSGSVIITDENGENIYTSVNHSIKFVIDACEYTVNVEIIYMTPYKDDLDPSLYDRTSFTINGTYTLNLHPHYHQF